MHRQRLALCRRAGHYASSIAAVALMLSFAGTACAATACRLIAFQKGASSAQVRGQAPAEGAECLKFSARRGQNVQLSVQSAHDQVAFSIEGLIDDRLQHAFTSEKPSYTLLVFQTMKAVAPVKYVLTLSIR